MIFISYSNQDRLAVESLVSELKGLGCEAWWDRSLLPGVPISEQIERAIKEATAIIFVVSKNSASSAWFHAEIAQALALNDAGDKKMFFPVVLGKDTDLPFFLRKYQAIWIADKGQIKEAAKEIYKTIQYRASHLVESNNNTSEFEEKIVDYGRTMLNAQIADERVEWAERNHALKRAFVVFLLVTISTVVATALFVFNDFRGLGSNTFLIISALISVASAGIGFLFGDREIWGGRK